MQNAAVDGSRDAWARSRGRWRHGARRWRPVPTRPAPPTDGPADEVVAHLADGLAAERRAVLRVRPGGRLESLTPEGSLWIEHAWGCWVGPHLPPDAVTEWLETGLKRLETGCATPHRPLSACGARGRVTLRLVPGVGGRDPLVIAHHDDDPAATSTVAAAALTPREADVLTELSCGHTNIRIARRLGIAERTVKTHLERIYAKLGVDNRVAAVAFGAQAVTAAS